MRRYVRPGVVFGVGLAVVLGVAGCSFNAPNAEKTIAQIRLVPILNDPPPGGDLLGRAEYLGNDQPGTAKDAGVTSIFAAPGSTFSVVEYYKSTYPQYNLYQESNNAEFIRIDGDDGWAVISVAIQVNTPFIPTPYDFKLKPARESSSTYVTVDIAGQTDSSGLNDPK